MHITLVGQYDPNQDPPGGIEVYLSGLHNYLEKRNISMLVLGWSRTKTSLQGFIPIMISKQMKGPLYALNLFLKAPFLKIPGDSIIHVQRPDHLIPFLLRKNRIILTLHGAHIENVRLKKGRIAALLYDFIQKIALKRADAVISVSERHMNYFLGKYPGLKDKTVVIPPGVDPIFRPADRVAARQKLGLPEDGKLLVFIGRLEREKRVDILIEKSPRGKGYTLLIVGEGRARKCLMKSARGYEQVIFTGAVAHNKVPDLINCADVVVLMSSHEGMPTVILESLACGVPGLCTDVGDVKNVVSEGKTGYIVTRDNFAKKVEELLESKTNFREHAIAAAKAFSWENIGTRIMEVYRGLEDENFS